MPRAKKVDETAALSERMLEVLESRRAQGPGAYTPTLRQLAEACGIPPEDERILNAVTRKPFTEKATAKATGKVGLELMVYFKEEVPSKAELARRALAELAGRMVRVLESQRDLGGEAYPPTLARLAELCGLRSSNPLVPKAATHETMAAEATFANGGKPALNSPVLLNCDLRDEAEGWHFALLTFAFDKSRQPKKALAFTPKQLGKKLQAPLQKSFEEELKARIARKGLPPGYAWLANKEPLIFRLDDLQPGLPTPSVAPEAPRVVPPPPSRGFAGAFREAFDRLDRHDGLSNNVKLVDLRRELADFDRQRFDAGLRQLRVDREFSLDSHEGLLRPLTAEEREAGIAESGSLLVYVSRR